MCVDVLIVSIIAKVSLCACLTGEDLKQTELRMLLLGRSNTGKSVAGNMILKDAVDTALPKVLNAGQ